MKKLIISVVVISSIIISIVFANRFMNYFVPEISDCPTVMAPVDNQNKSWNIEFAQNEYGEIKDLAKAFLTLLIGVFVASITFSEKIVDIKSSFLSSKILLIICWIFLIICIGLTGCGLAFLSATFSEALHYPCTNTSKLFNNASLCFEISGLIFGFALLSMLISGILSTLKVKESN